MLIPQTEVKVPGRPVSWQFVSLCACFCCLITQGTDLSEDNTRQESLPNLTLKIHCSSRHCLGSLSLSVADCPLIAHSAVTGLLGDSPLPPRVSVHEHLTVHMALRPQTSALSCLLTVKPRLATLGPCSHLVVTGVRG